MKLLALVAALALAALAQQWLPAVREAVQPATWFPTEAGCSYPVWDLLSAARQLECITEYPTDGMLSAYYGD